jgi:hypothetical protein
VQDSHLFLRGACFVGPAVLVTGVMIEFQEAIDEFIGRHPVCTVFYHGDDEGSDACFAGTGAIPGREDRFCEGVYECPVLFEGADIGCPVPFIPFISGESEATAGTGEQYTSYGFASFQVNVVDGMGAG